MERYLNHIIKSTEIRVEEFLKNQVMEEESFEYGRLKSEILEGKPTIYVLALAAAVYENKKSRLYHNRELYVAMNRALDFIGRYQREDGSFDFPSCNFKSAADTSFCFKRLIGGYRILEQYDQDGHTRELQEKYLVIMKRSLSAIAEGGFHTPNHRWGITAALLQGAALFPGTEFSQMLKARAAVYLREGIDGNDDGEYAERSTGNYNAVVNNSMMAMYEETGDVSYLGYVERNLHMMLTYIDPDDTIFTQNSTRQDQGKSDYPDKYFYQYLFMASAEAEINQEYRKEFARAAHKIIKDNMERGDLAPECLHIIMIHPTMMNYQLKEYGFLDRYRKFYKDAGVLRVKTKDFGYSVLKGSSNFLFLKVKDTPVYVKIGESIGPVRCFQAETMEVDEKTGECMLSSVVESRYYLPFSTPPDTSDWWRMDHSKREVLVNSKIHLEVRIKEVEAGLELKVKGEGLDRVPLRLQVCIPFGAVLENKHFYLRAPKGEGMILRDGYVTMNHHGNQMMIGPGFGTHEFRGHYSGEEVNDTGYTICFHDYLPLERVITLECI